MKQTPESINRQATIRPRLINLHERVMGLQEKFPSHHLMAAASRIDDILLKNEINFDQMLEITANIERWKKSCPGSIWLQVADLVIAADDILFDLPLPIITTDLANSLFYAERLADTQPIGGGE